MPRPPFPLWVLVAAAAAGCGDRPRAPALTTDAVFEDDRAGLRFVVPAGWVMTMRNAPPAGRFEKAVQLVRYQPPNPEAAADLELLAVDLPADADVGKYLDDHQPGGRTWAAGPRTPLAVGGAAATRYEYTVTGGKRAGASREVTAVRRGERVYLFLTTYKDTATRDQVRQAIDSVIWTGS